MCKSKNIFFPVLFAFCTHSFAQQAPPFSMLDAVTEGLENNYSILLARNSEQVSSNNATIGNAGMLPSVTLNGTLNKGIANSKQTFINGTVQDKTGARSTNWNGNVALDWTVFDGLAMFANYNRLKELEMMGRENLQASIQQTIASIMNVYFDIVSRQQELEATERILRISRLRTRSARDRFLGGKVSKVDLLSAQVDYNADTASYIQQTEGLKNAKIELNKLLAREITADFSASDSISIDQTLRYGKIHDMALAENPDVVLSRMSVNAAAFSLKATQGSRYPKVRLTSNYTLVKSLSATGQVEENNSKTFNYGATLSMPLFNGWNINREIRNAKLDKEAADIRYEQIQKDIEAQVATAYSTYEVNRKLAAFEAANLTLAAENLDISMDRYRLGAISAVELRDVQRSFISATNRLIVATYNAKIAETALKLLTGEVMSVQ
ncbi:MAG: TolC family protein [Bacteroidales bacterium]|jgi:outer membrane protein TolC|nr:TolC family protein [Bacteroidales bacterium]